MKVYFFGVPQLQKIWSSIKIVEAIGSGFPLYLLFHCIAQKDAASILNAEVILMSFCGETVIARRNDEFSHCEEERRSNLPN